MILQMPLCMVCKHRKKDATGHWFVCEAFPEGIPGEIITGVFKHTRKYPGDNGIRFEPAVKDEAQALKDKIDKSIRPYLGVYLEKDWSDWSKFRKPVYNPASKKSVAACKKFIAMGIVHPGCVNAVRRASEIYEPGKDNDQYIPFQPVDPKKLFSNIKQERDAEQQKQFAVNKIDQVFDKCFFYRDPAGRISILNWMSLIPEDKQVLSTLFNEKGMLLDSKYKEFDRRMKDYNSRRIKRGLEAKKVN
jgi:hypothetical protein